MRLKVQNFVCLQDVDVELNDITFFIGEQASGKSLLCKLYFYFRSVFFSRFIQAIVDNGNIEDYKKKLIDDFCYIFPKDIWQYYSFNIQLIIDGHLVSCVSYDKSNFDFFIFDHFEDVFNMIKDYYLKNIENPNNFSEKNLILKESIEELGSSQLFEDVIYVPSGRAFFSTVSDNIFGLIANNITIDFFLQSFGNQYERARHNRLEGINEKADSLIKIIIKKNIFIDKKDTFLISDDGIKTPLLYTSSGQQEALPLLLILRHLLVRKPFGGTQSVVIEEPEAHLFPTAQKAIVDLLFLIKQQSQTKHFLVTTHSPYILSCANNALLKNPDIKVNAYYLANGTAKCIMDDEVGLIDGIDLDGVSDTIADEFDKLIHGKYDD